MATTIKITITAILILQAYFSFSQTWPKIYGEPDRMDFSYDIEESYDMGYFILGGYDNSYYFPKYTWLIKTDINGNSLWEKILKCDGFVKSFALEPTLDGGLLICGGILLNDYGLLYFPFLIKLNACGEKEWCKVFADGLDELPWAQDVKETSSGNIILLINQYGESPEETMHLFKLNEFGEVLWKNPYASGYIYPCENARGNNLFITSDEKYLICAQSYWPDPWNSNGVVILRPTFVMVNSSGVEEWVMPYGIEDTIIGTANNVMEISDGNFIGVGSYWYSQQLLDPLFMNFNNNGEELGHSIISSQLIDSTIVKGSFLYSIIIDSIMVHEGLFGNSAIPSLYDVLSNQSIFDTNFSILAYQDYIDNRDPMSMNITHDNKIISNSFYLENDISLASSRRKLSKSIRLHVYPGGISGDSG